MPLSWVAAVGFGVGRPRSPAAPISRTIHHLTTLIVRNVAASVCSQLVRVGADAPSPGNLTSLATLPILQKEVMKIGILLSLSAAAIVAAGLYFWAQRPKAYAPYTRTLQPASNQKRPIAREKVETVRVPSRPPRFTSSDITRRVPRALVALLEALVQDPRSPSSTHQRARDSTGFGTGMLTSPHRQSHAPELPLGSRPFSASPHEQPRTIRVFRKLPLNRGSISAP